MTPQKPQVWQIDKRIPLALILTVVIQTVGLAVWLGGLSNRVSTLEIVINPVVQRTIDNSEKTARQDEKLVGLQKQVDDNRGEIRRITLRGK